MSQVDGLVVFVTVLRNYKENIFHRVFNKTGLIFVDACAFFLLIRLNLNKFDDKTKIKYNLEWRMYSVPFVVLHFIRIQKYTIMLTCASHQQLCFHSLI